MDPLSIRNIVLNMFLVYNIEYSVLSCGLTSFLDIFIKKISRKTCLFLVLRLADLLKSQ